VASERAIRQAPQKQRDGVKRDEHIQGRALPTREGFLNHLEIGFSQRG
jgi:hypothetical protein